jgi:hypothetical protein
MHLGRFAGQSGHEHAGELEHGAGIDRASSFRESGIEELQEFASGP